VRNCPVDWNDPDSVDRLVVEPRKLSPSVEAEPLIRNGEKVRESVLLLEYLISAEGVVEDVCVLRSISHTIDAHYVAKARESRFRPGTLCGIPAAFSSIVTIHHHAWRWPREPER
jgi:hypothetical protein